MAEENKPQQEVDIDTDGVNEEIINVDKPIEPNETAQGNRNATSKSNIINKIATK